MNLNAEISVSLHYKHTGCVVYSGRWLRHAFRIILGIMLKNNNIDNMIMDIKYVG